MSKYLSISLIGLSLLILAACAPYINAANKNMITIYVPNTSFESEALKMADDHCARYGLSAKLRKPRASSTAGSMYDYNCVK